MIANDCFIPPGMSCLFSDDPTSATIAALADRLRRQAQPAGSLAEALALVEPLAEVARRWLDDSNPIRAEALARLPAAGASPFPRPMWRAALAAMFEPITAETLARFVRTELAGLDQSRFPRLIGQVLAGNVPAPAVQTIFCGLLAGAGQLVKTAADDPLFPVLLARSMAAVQPALADRLAVVNWPGERQECNAALASAAEVVIAFGRSESIAVWRGLTSDSGSRLIGHGPRTSLELIELPADEARWPVLADRIAADIALYDQQGCLSPQQVYLAGGAESAVGFARALGEALARRSTEWPVPRRELGQALAIRQAREAHRVRRLTDGLNSPGPPWLPSELVGPADHFAWTLLSTAGAAPQIGPGGRTVFLTRVASLGEAIEAIRLLAGVVQGVALEVESGAEFDRRAADLGEQLGIPYVCRPGQLQRPPFGWRNDGIQPLRSLAGP